MFEYIYSKEPSGKYDKPYYFCVTKRKDGKFEWCWSFPSEAVAKQFADDHQRKQSDLPYPGRRI